MFEFFFGVTWISITAVVTIGMYSGTADTIYVNDELVTQAEFNEMIGPKVLLGIFWAIGLFILFWALKNIIKDKKTSILGEICFGKIIDIFESGSYVNDVPQLKAEILFYIPSTNEVKTVSEVIGLYGFCDHYKIGRGVEVKYYNGDINFLKVLESYELPVEAQSAINEFDLPMQPKERVIRNGVEYIRKDLVDKKSRG